MKLPNGYGSIYKLSGNRRKPWIARAPLDPATNERKPIGYYPSKEEAISALVHWHENPYDIDAASITFAGLFEKWSAEHFPKISDSNVKGYNASFKAAADIHSVRFADLRTSHLQGVIDHCGKNFPTLKKIRVLFSVLYKYALQNDIVTKDYSEFVDLSQYRNKNPDSVDRAPFSSDEISRLWEVEPSNVYYSVILMMIYNGVRVSELLDLKKENVSLEGRYFDVIASKTQAGIRRVPIAAKTQRFYEYWYNLRSDCDYLLSAPDGKHFTYRNYYDSYWSPLMDNLQMEHRPHDTRHTCATLLDAAEVDPRIVKMILGHAGQGVTEQVYTHREFSRLLDAIDRI